MHYVLAWCNKNDFILSEKYNMKHILLSQLDKSWLKNMLPLLTKDHSIIIDSWAFTVWTKWSVIDIDEYWKRCVDIQKQFWHKTTIYFVSLDVIPSRPWVKPTKQDREDSAKQSWENFQFVHAISFSTNIMRFGVRPVQMPTLELERSVPLCD